MSNESNATYFKAQLNPETGRLEISVISNSEIIASENNVFRMSLSEKSPFQSVDAQSAKIDPKSMTEDARLRPMWEKTTCDIIK